MNECNTYGIILRMETKSLITQAVELVGLSRLAKACGVTYPAIRKWQKAGRLPRTEWTGETDYASVIERESEGKIAKAQLLQKPVKQEQAREN